MSSPLRLQTVVDTTSTQSYYPRALPAVIQPKKSKMSLTQTYYIASSARTKLGREASRADHDLRLLVGHANLLDVLMVELQDAEREQETWFNDSIRKASKPEQPRHVQWIDSIAEDLDEDSDSDSEDDVYAEEEEVATPVKAVPTSAIYTVSSQEIDEDYEDDEVYAATAFRDFEYDDEHALTRVDSHPPELVHEDSSDSEDDSMPPSPPQSTAEFTHAQPIKTTPYLDKMDYQSENIINIPQSSQMISAY